MRASLKAALGRSGRAAEDVSVELGRHPTFLGRLLRGKAKLRVEEVFHLLAVLDITPSELFFRAFPLGGFGESRLIERYPATFEPEAYPRHGYVANRELVSLARWERGGENPSSVALALEAGKVLRTLVHARARTLKKVAASVGMSPKSLGSRLSGRAELTFETLFRVLEEIDVSPGRYFLQLLVLQRSALDRMQWKRMLDFAEEHRRRGAAVLLEREEERRVRAPRDEGENGEADEGD